MILSVDSGTFTYGDLRMHNEIVGGPNEKAIARTFFHGRHHSLSMVWPSPGPKIAFNLIPASLTPGASRNCSALPRGMQRCGVCTTTPRTTCTNTHIWSPPHLPLPALGLLLVRWHHDNLLLHYTLSFLCCHPTTSLSRRYPSIQSRTTSWRRRSS